MNYRVSWADGIGFSGIILTVVFLVLDKAGKLKGGLLVGLLVLGGVMTLFVALGNSWVLDGPARWRIWRGLMMFSLVALTYSGLALWISSGNDDKPETPKAVENEIPNFVPSFAISPRIGASPGSYDPWPIPKDAAIVTMIVKIENKGAPSITKHWRFELTTADGVVHDKVVHVIPSFKELTLYQDKDEEIKGVLPPVLHPEDDIQDKTASQAIAHDAAPVGFIIYVVPDVTYKTPRQKGTKFKLSFEDINGKRYECSHVGTGVRDIQPQYVPGLNLYKK